MEEDFSPYVPDFFHDCRMFQSLFHCLESISEREPLLEIAKNFAGNNAKGVVSREIQILLVRRRPQEARGKGRDPLTREGSPKNYISQIKD